MPRERPLKRASSPVVGWRTCERGQREAGSGLEGDQRIGVRIVKRALEEPMRYIASNAGAEGSIVVQKVRDEDETTMRL